MARNRLGGLKVRAPGGYRREAGVTFGAGTLRDLARVVRCEPRMCGHKVNWEPAVLARPPLVERAGARPPLVANPEDTWRAGATAWAS